MILQCIKTGRFWFVTDMSHGMRRARDLGLVDYEIGPRQ